MHLTREMRKNKKAQKRDKAKLSEVEVNITLPYIGGIRGKWIPDESEKRAAWEIYIELITRVATIELKPGEGLLRESLKSIYSIFSSTREILRKYGPSIADTGSEKDISLGFISIAFLNTVLRPFLSKWHPRLLEHEGKRDEDCSIVHHEERWECNEEFREELREVQVKLQEYASLLASVAGVPYLHIDLPDIPECEQ